MAAAAIATLSLSSVPCKKRPRNGASTFNAHQFSNSSSCCHTFTLRPRAPRPRAASRVVVAQAGTGTGGSSYKVAILGAAGGVGEPLALLAKMSPLVSALHLYDDDADVEGVAADLSHCNTPAQVAGFTGKDELAGCLSGADVVVIAAGAPREPGMTRDDDLFGANAGVVRDLAAAVADHAPPGALVHVITDPVDSTVPVAAEVLKRRGAASYDPRRLFGVTTLDVVRANAFVAARKALPVADVDVPVVCGHAAGTILPLLSKARPKAVFTEEEVEELTARIRSAGDEVVEAKAGAGSGSGSATLSMAMAYAAARFLEASLRGLAGHGDVYECAYVQSQVVPELPFFACRVKLGRDGVEEVLGSELRGLTDYEARELEALKPTLKASIDKGIAYVQQNQEAALN